MPLILAFLAGCCFTYWLMRRDAPPSSSAPPRPAPPPTYRPPVRDITDDEVEDLIRAGLYLEAIKRYRDIHHVSLAQAQTDVDTLAALLKRK